MPPTTSTFPSASPSDSPTWSEMEYLVKLLSPLSGQEALLDSTTPQYQAFQWLATEDTYHENWQTAPLADTNFTSAFGNLPIEEIFFRDGRLVSVSDVF